MGIFLRWLGAFALLSATFNPSQWNFIRWAEANYATQMPLTLLLGLLLGRGIYGLYRGHIAIHRRVWGDFGGRNRWRADLGADGLWGSDTGQHQPESVAGHFCAVGGVGNWPVMEYPAPTPVWAGIGR